MLIRPSPASRAQPREYSSIRSISSSRGAPADGTALLAAVDTPKAVETTG